MITAQGSLTLPSTTMVTVAAAAGADRLVISKMRVKSGDSVFEGEVVAEVSGRPVFLMEGRVPAYRALTQGLKGGDVLQLQAALARLGFQVAQSGRFDAQTQDGLRALYASAGYSPVEGGSGGGVTLPIDEITYIPTLPATVAHGGSRIGDAVSDGPILTISTGLPAVRIALSPVDARVVQPGQLAQVQVPGRSQPLKAHVVGAVRDSPGTNGETLGEATLRLESQQGLGSAKTVTVTMRVTLSEGKVLAVPISAVWTAGDGTDQVTVLAPDGSRRDIEVAAGSSGDGYVEVRAASLHAGERVVVG